tara:strand:+ start:4583 stop:4753 length:171 start_codon:yes stop_codon:yes gene_type:complete
MKRTIEDGRGRRNYDAVRLPEITEGNCRRSRRCKSFNVTLGDGLCMTCWDKGARRR